MMQYNIVNTTRYPKPCFTIILIDQKRFNPFDSVPLVTLCFEILRHQIKPTL